jgi:hypothetical protein
VHIGIEEMMMMMMMRRRWFHSINGQFSQLSKERERECFSSSPHECNIRLDLSSTRGSTSAPHRISPSLWAASSHQDKILHSTLWLFCPDEENVISPNFTISQSTFSILSPRWIVRYRHDYFIYTIEESSRGSCSSGRIYRMGCWNDALLQLFPL